MKKYDYILTDLVFLPEEILRSDDVHGQYIFRGDFKGSQTLIKIISIINSEKVTNLRKEYLVTTDLFKNKIFGKGLVWGQDDKFVWYIKEFVDGLPLAHYDESPLIALYGYDVLNADLVSESSKIIPKIYNLLKSIRSTKMVTNLPPSFNKKRWATELENYHLAEIEKGIGSPLSHPLSFYNKSHHEYLASNKTSLCLGDLVPANILFDDETSKISFIDLEWSCLDNREVDLSFLWLFLWRYPDWQKSLLDLFENDIDEDSFRASVIRQTIGWFDAVFKQKAVPTDRDLIGIYRTHIWVKYLFAASESYEKLINTK